jgi:muramidase (phage lysozyme)
MHGLPPEARRLLDVIAGVESPGYDVLHGGSRFSGYGDHPRQPVEIKKGPNKGKHSTAAGRYQFIGSTWDRAKAATGVKDFSPESQDIAAWWLAQEDYKSRTGRDLLGDLRSGDPATLARVRGQLAPTWEGLAKRDDGWFQRGMGNQSPDTYSGVPGWGADSPSERMMRSPQTANDPAGVPDAQPDFLAALMGMMGKGGGFQMQPQQQRDTGVDDLYRAHANNPAVAHRPQQQTNLLAYLMGGGGGLLG